MRCWGSGASSAATPPPSASTRSARRAPWKRPRHSSASRQRRAVPATADLLDTPDAGAAIIRGGSLRIVGYLVGVAISVVSSVLLLRHLGVVASGYYVTILSLVTLTGGVTEAGLAAIGVRELSTLPPERVRSFFRSLAGL